MNRGRNEVLAFFALMAFAVCFGFLVLILTSCGDQCETEVTRCSENAVEICNADGDWDVVMECDDVWSADGAEWQCCIDPDDGEATCFLNGCES